MPMHRRLRRFFRLRPPGTAMLEPLWFWKRAPNRGLAARTGQYALMTPFAMELGIAPKWASVVWLCGPVTGMFVQVCAHVCAYVYAHVCAHACPCTCTHVCAHVYAHACAHIYAHARARAYAFLCACLCTCLYARLYTFPYIYQAHNFIRPSTMA